jgi:hypothetical protein
MGKPPAKPGGRIGLTETLVCLVFMVRPRAVKEKSMPDNKSQAHTRWDCKYHLVFIPKKRQKIIYGKFQKYKGEIIHELARNGNCEGAHGFFISIVGLDEMVVRQYTRDQERNDQPEIS